MMHVLNIQAKYMHGKTCTNITLISRYNGYNKLIVNQFKKLKRNLAKDKFLNKALTY